METPGKRILARILARCGILLPVLNRYHARRSGARSRAGAGSAVPPPHLLMAATGTTDAAWYLESGRLAFEQASAWVPLERESRVLDFGCGCGRLLRHLVATGGEVFGLDPNREAVSWCRRHFPEATLARLPPRAPLAFPDEHFDTVLALSVFTHLSVASQIQWLGELRRVLKPDGRLLLTLHGEAYLDRLSPDERARFEAGEIVVQWSAAEGSNLCAAYHPRGSLLGIGHGYELLEFQAAAAAGTPSQDLYVLKRRQDDAQPAAS